MKYPDAAMSLLGLAAALCPLRAPAQNCPLELAYSSFLGGEWGDEAVDVAVDSDDCVYVVGSTYYVNMGLIGPYNDFPTANAYQPLPFDGNEAFIVKLDASKQGAASLIYATLLGGESTEWGNGIAVDAWHCAYVAGETLSVNFPTTPAAFQTRISSNLLWPTSNAFVTKLNAAGNALLYSTYLGGTGGDNGASGIAVDGSGCAYIAGATYSPAFPTSRPLQGYYAGGRDGFVSKLSPSGSTLIYSTYLGGGGGDRCAGVEVDSSGCAYVVGTTGSSSFPVRNCFQGALGGGDDAFVAKLDPQGGSLEYSTYLGGRGSDLGHSIALWDTDGRGVWAYVAGETASTDFPVQSAYQSRRAGRGGADAFISAVDADGRSLVVSTYLGGSAEDRGYGIALDSFGNVHVTGATRSRDFPALHAYQSQYPVGNLEAFAARLDHYCVSLAYSTCLGGDHPDWGFAVACDSEDRAVIVGATQSCWFPVTPNAYLQTPPSQDVFEAFVTKLAFDLLPGENFAGAIPLDSYTLVRGDTSQYSNQYTSYNGCPYSETGADVVYIFDAPEGYIWACLDDLSCDLDLFLCDSSRNCVAYSCKGSTSAETINYYAYAGTWYLVVDGYGGAQGSYRIELQL